MLVSLGWRQHVEDLAFGDAERRRFGEVRESAGVAGRLVDDFG